MLTIKIGDNEYWDEKTQTFLTIKGQTVQLEHSLVSVSKWEARWHKPFLSTSERTKEETLDYIKCMTITQNVNPNVYKNLTGNDIKLINAYISNPMSAKIFRKEEGKGHVYSDTTSDDIYYLMVAYQIPFECQKWHLNRLISLIKLCDQHNKPEKNKMRPRDYAQYRSKLNAARKAKLKPRG